MAICDGAMAKWMFTVVYLSMRRDTQFPLDSVCPQQSPSDEAISLSLEAAERGNLRLTDAATGFVRPFRAVELFVRSWVDGAI
jgi:hypothetical protein